MDGIIDDYGLIKGRAFRDVHRSMYFRGRKPFETCRSDTLKKEAAPYGKPKLLEQLRQALRARHYSPKTEKAYAFWSRLWYSNGSRTSRPQRCSDDHDLYPCTESRSFMCIQPPGWAMIRSFMRIHITRRDKYCTRLQPDERKSFMAQTVQKSQVSYADRNRPIRVLCGAV